MQEDEENIDAYVVDLRTLTNTTGNPSSVCVVKLVTTFLKCYKTLYEKF